MTQPPNAVPPNAVPPPPPPYGGPPPAYMPPSPAGHAPLPPAGYGPPPGYAPPAGYAMPSGAQPGRGRVSATRLITVFVVVLAIGLALAAAVVLALQPAAKKPNCPDPSIPCGAPPVAPTLPPVARSSPAPAATPAPTIVRPSGSLVLSSPAQTRAPSVGPSTAPTVVPTPAPSASTAPTPSASVARSTAPSNPPSNAPATPSGVPLAADLPQPRPATNAEPLRIGTVWTSSSLGFRLEYDNQQWEVQNESATALALSAGQGSVVIVIEGFKAASSSPKSLVQQKVKSLSDVILGLTEETDASRQLPGQPVVGHRQGFGTLMNGTINTPQGPGSNVDVVILAASDNQISIRVTVLTDDDLRDAAFSAADQILNSIEWPADAQ